jgi:hypothetical protein
MHAPNNLVDFASSSPVARMRRLIRPWTAFPATCQTSTLRSTFGTASYRQLAGSGTFPRAHVATPMALSGPRVRDTRYKHYTFDQYGTFLDAS